MLAVLLLEALAPGAARALPRGTGRRTQPTKTWSVWRSSWLATVAAGQQLGFFAQESVVSSLKKLYPGDWFCGFKFPMIEDIITQEPFVGYLE